MYSWSRVRSLAAAFFFVSGWWSYGASLNVLYSFPSNAAPNSALVQGSDGALYGTTLYDGPTGDGSVFRISTNNVFTDLHLFNYFDGSHPSDELTIGPDGAFYGTTATGGPGLYGTVFRITTNGTDTTIAFFS
jgi:uncharacterized repeat protein (TIGR03803 family)